MIQDAVLPLQIRLGRIRRNPVIRMSVRDRVSFQHLRYVHDIGIHEIMMEVCVVIPFTECKDILQMVQLRQIIGKHLVKEGQISLQLHPLRLPERRSRLR